MAMRYKHYGIKAVGHMLKGLLPLSVFTRILRTYHWVRGCWALPKSRYAAYRVAKTINRVRTSPRPVRFGFYVVLDSMFQLRHVYELMREDPRFSPFIVVVPRIGWHESDLQETVERTYASLVATYGPENIYRGYHDGIFENHLQDCDACSMMNLYHGLADPRFETECFARHGVPIFASSYFYEEGTIHSPEYYGMPSLKFLWRFYASHAAEVGKFLRYQKIRGKTDRVKCVGCAKTDPIRFCGATSLKPNKTILLAPHHSVLPNIDDGFCIGNFLRYKDLFLTLPRRYPGIHWIFRPHPHLRLRLTKDYTWKMEDWDAYVREFEANVNAEYEAGGAYYESFERSDAIIQDCASFLPEYFYTGKPCCYILASEAAKDAQFDDWGQELLSHTYQAFTEQEIIRFVEDVVIGGNDTMREMRQKFAKEKVMINYPHASEAVLEDIAETLGRGKEQKP